MRENPGGSTGQEEARSPRTRAQIHGLSVVLALSPQLSVAQAAAALQRGQVIAYPTESVYGLGCDPNNPEAVTRILALKGRPRHKGLILLGADIQQLQGWIDRRHSSELARARTTWPGPTTWIFTAEAQCRSLACREDGTVAIRISAHTVAAELARAFGGLIVSTSANPEGQTPAGSPAEVQGYFGPELPLVAGVLGHRGRPSEIRTASDGRVLRHG